MCCFCLEENEVVSFEPGKRNKKICILSLSLFFFFLNLISLAKGLSFLFIFSKRGLRCHRKLSTSQLLLVAWFLYTCTRENINYVQMLSVSSKITETGMFFRPSLSADLNP